LLNIFYQQLQKVYSYSLLDSDNMNQSNTSWTILWMKINWEHKIVHLNVLQQKRNNKHAIETRKADFEHKIWLKFFHFPMGLNGILNIVLEAFGWKPTLYLLWMFMWVAKPSWESEPYIEKIKELTHKLRWRRSDLCGWFFSSIQSPSGCREKHFQL